MITASQLNQRLVLQKPVYSQDELGGAMVTWQDAATLWASVKPVRGGERFASQRIESRQLFKIIIRYRGDVLPSHRFRKDTRVFSVLSVENVDEAGHTLEIVAEEIK